MTSTATPQATDLQPCPFCGEKADLRCTVGPDPDWFVECSNCHASAAVFNQDKLDGWNLRVQHQGEPVALAIPEECPHLIVFDDAEVTSLMFSGSGARAAALKKWEAISTSWNAHLFVRVARNSRDDGHACAIVADLGEVERLREGISKHWKVVCVQRAELDTLRAQLAELVSAVRSINFAPAHAIRVRGDDEPCYPQRKEWIEWLLGLCSSASAKPSMPVEGGSHAEFEAAYSQEVAVTEVAFLTNPDGSYALPVVNTAYRMWQAGAAKGAKA